MDQPANPPPGTFPFTPGAKFDPLIGARMMNSRGHGEWLGMRYHAHGDDWIELALPWRADLVGVAATGVLALGPIISLMDNATSMSVWTRLKVWRPQVTVDLRVDYMRAAAPGKTVIARCECYKVTRSIAFVRGIAYDEAFGDPVAHATGTFISMDGTGA